MRIRGNKETRPPRVRLIALPHAGGWPSAFNVWRKLLPGHVELLVGQLPGRGFRSDEPPLRRVAPLVHGLAQALEALDPLPYAIVGHSFGSVLAYELTRMMERAGSPPRLLAVSARQPPCFPSRAPYAYKKTDAELLEHLVGMGGVPNGLVQRTDLVNVALRAVRADLEALETYKRPPTGTDVPILSVGASDDPVVVADRLYLWSVETSGSFTQLLLEGGHFYLYSPPAATRVIEHIMARLHATPPAEPVHAVGWPTALEAARA
jgi:surfactin synthase thioesterase subunit